MMHSQRVLVIEGDPADADLICHALAPTGEVAIGAEVTRTLRDATALLDAHCFDLAILELSLPDSQGLETLVTLRQAAPALAVIVLTSSDDPQLQLACFRQGAKDVIGKTAGGGSLFAAATSALRTRQLERSLQRKVEDLERSEARYLSLFNRMLDGFADHEVICDEAGEPVDYRFLAINPAFEKQTGLKASDVIGRRVLEVMPDTERHWIETYGKVGLTGQPVHFESFAEALGKHFEVTAFQSRPGHFACLFLDVTARARAEEELRRFNDELEQRVEARTVALATANDELEAFTSSVSHDLRAPLRAITGFAEIIAQRYRASLDDKALHYFDNIVEAGDRMGRLLEALREYSRLGKHGLVLQPLAPSPVLAAVVRELEPRIAACEAELTLPPAMPVVRGSEALVRKVLFNLLDNALTYRAPERRPRVTVSARTTGDWLVIAVTDNGIGIAPEYHQKIFDVFQRLHQREQYSGTGVGLAIVRKATLLMNGTFEVRSALGRGSTFEIALQRASEDKQEG